MNHHASGMRRTSRYSLNFLGGGAFGQSFAANRYTRNATLSGITASPSTAFQPKAFARPGANSEANTVPELPAPAIPSAIPWYCGGYQREASGNATANEAPATPSTSPNASVPE